MHISKLFDAPKAAATIAEVASHIDRDHYSGLILDAARVLCESGKPRYEYLGGHGSSTLWSDPSKPAYAGTVRVTSDGEVSL